MTEKEKRKFIAHYAIRLNKSTLMAEDDAYDFISDVVHNFEQIKNIKKPKEYCKCEHPLPNYPEMVWCDRCGKEIKVNRCHICGGENGHHTYDCTYSSRPIII